MGALGAVFAILFRLAGHVVGNPNVTAGFAALPPAARWRALDPGEAHRRRGDTSRAPATT